MKRKWVYCIVAIILSIICTVSILGPSVVSADGYDPSSALDGAGTVIDPYKISTANELAYLANLVNQHEGWLKTQGNHYMLTNDIYLNDISSANWTKSAKEWIYGTADEIQQSSFKGHLDGNGFTVYGLYIKTGAKKYNGLFPGIMGGATVENIGFSDCYIDASAVSGSEVGGLAGAQHIWPTDQVLNISKCYVGSSVNLNGAVSGGFVGHIVRKTVITDCYSLQNDSSSPVKGSLIGDVDKNISLEINSSYNTSAIPFTGVKEGGGDVTFNGSYSTSESKPGLAKISLEKLIGTDASQYIDMLDFEGVWETKDGSTPILSVFNKSKPPIVAWSGGESVSLNLEDPALPNSFSNPYLISSGEDLAALAKTVYNGEGVSTQNKFYKLTNDIYLNDTTNSEWASSPEKWNYGTIKKDVDSASSQTTINNSSFYGHLDGNGKVIRGIYETNTALQGSAGLFTSLGGGAEIINLGFEDCFIKIKRNVGIIAGITTDNSDPTEIRIANCYVADSVNLIQESTSASYAGGFIGRLRQGITVENCYSSAQISKTDWQRIGGIIGGAWDVSYNVTFNNCYNTQNNEYGIEPGGNFFIFEGNTTGTVVFSNCYTTGNTRDCAGLIKVALADMTGLAAKTNMPNLGYSSSDYFYCSNGKTPQLISFRKSVPDTTSPQFSSAIENNAASTEAIEIAWKSATDNITAKEHLVYEIYISESALSDELLSSDLLVGTITGETTFVTEGLEFGKSYHFAVKVKDGSNNTATIFTVSPFATRKSENNVWDGTVAKMFESGKGTEENPYRIVNAEQLAHLVDIVNNQPADTTKDKYYIIDDDIYLNNTKFENWKNMTPREWKCGISSTMVAKGFAGTLDGNNHVIHGIYINESGGNFNGLFTALDCSAHIKNLGILDSYISSYEYKSDISTGSMSGALAATVAKLNFGDKDNPALIEKCFSDETVYVQATYAAGGLIGSALTNDTNVKFVDCYSGAKIETDTNSGSILGDAWNPSYTVRLEGCYGSQPGMTLVGHTSTIPTYDKCYSNVVSAEGITKVFDWQMRGTDAIKNMPAFDFENTWGYSEKATPYLLSFKNSSYGVDFPLIEVSFETNGGNIIEPVYAYTGAKLNFPTPVKEGYKFVGWYVYKDLDIKYPIDTFPGYDLTLFAKWEDIAVIRQDFEFYSYLDPDYEGLGDDYEYYRPGVLGFDPINVHGGSKAIHRIGKSSKSSLFQVFNDDSATTIKSGKKYKISLWVNLVNAKKSNGYISIVSTDVRDVSKSAKAMMNVYKTSDLAQGKWQLISAEFISKGKYLSILTPGSAEMYIDDIVIIPYDGQKAGTMNLAPPNISADKSDSKSEINDDGKNSSEQEQSKEQDNNISDDTSKSNTDADTDEEPTEEYNGTNEDGDFGIASETTNISATASPAYDTQDEVPQTQSTYTPGKTTKTITSTSEPDYLYLYISIGFAAAALLVSPLIIISIVKIKKSEKGSVK